MTQSDSDVQERTDTWEALGRELLIRRLQRTGSDAHDAMHKAAADLLHGEDIDRDDVRRLERAHAEYEEAVEMVRELSPEHGERAED